MTFDEWMNEIENFSTRRERCGEESYKWAKTAWDLQQEKIERLESILRKIFPDKSGDIFICGEAGEKDSMGLPERVFICPTYGLDGFAVYRKERDYDSPGY